MAQRTLAVKYTTDGFNEAIASLRKVGQSFDDALASSQKAVAETVAASKKALSTGDTKAYQEAEAARVRAAKQGNAAIQNAYRELRVKQTADIEDLKKQAISAFNAIKNSGVASAQDIANAQAALTRRLKELDAQLDQTGKQAKSLGEGFTVLKGTIAGIASGAILNAIGSVQNAIAGLTQNVIAAGTQAERQRVAFETFLGSAEKANKLLAEVRTFAATTPFQLPEITEAAKQLLAVQVEADKVIPTIKMLGEIAAGADKPLSQLLFTYVQIKNQGKATAEEINQLYNAGLSNADFAKALGIAENQVKELASEGKIGFAEVQKTIESMTAAGGRFAGLMDKLGGTTAVKLSNLEDAFGNIYRTIYEGIEPALSGVLDVVVATLTPLGENKTVWQGINEQSKEFQEYLKQNPQIAQELAEQLEEGVKVALDAITDLAKGTLEYLQQNPTAIADAVEQLKFLTSAMGGFISLINTAITGWKEIALLIENVTGRLGQGSALDLAAANQVTKEEIVARFQQLYGFDPFMPGAGLAVKIGSFGQRNISDMVGEVVQQLVGERAGQRIKEGTTGQPRTVGYVGRTGLGTGPHLDIRVKNQQGQYIDPSAYYKYFSSDGKPLTDYKVTSPRGMRTHPVTGQRKMHEGVDFGIKENRPVVFTGQGQISYKPNQGNAGNVTEIKLSTGETIQLLHLNKFGDAIDKTTQSVSNLGKTSSQIATAKPSSSVTASPPISASKIDVSQNYARLGELTKTLTSNKYFDPTTDKGKGALATALIIAAGESGAQWLKAGSSTDLFNALGGSGDNMQGFLQYNRAYFRNETSSRTGYLNLAGSMLTGERRLPTGRGQFDAAKLSQLVQSGQITTQEQLLKYLQSQISINDWHGLHEKGGGGGRIRESGILKEALKILSVGKTIATTPSEIAQNQIQSAQELKRQEEEKKRVARRIIEETRSRTDQRIQQEQQLKRQQLQQQQQQELLKFDVTTSEMPEGGAKEARETIRQQLEKQQAAASERLEIEQTINTLLTERDRKIADQKAGLSVTGKDITAEINFLESRKKLIDENLALEKQLLANNTAAQLTEKSKVLGEEIKSVDQIIEEAKATIAERTPENREIAAINEINAQYDTYNQTIESAIAQATDLIDLKTALGESTDAETTTLEALRAKQQELNGIKEKAIALTKEQLDLQNRQTALSNSAALADLNSQIVQTRAGQLSQYGDSFASDRLLKQDAIAQENLRYSQQQLDLEAQYGNDSALLDQFKTKASELNSLKLDGIKSEFNTLGQIVQDVTQQGLTTLGTELLDFNQSIGDAFRDTAMQVLGMIKQIALQIAVSGIMGAIFGTGGQQQTQQKQSGGSGWLSTLAGIGAKAAGSYFGGGFAKGGAIGETWTSWGGSKNWGSFETPLSKVTPPVVLPIQPPPMPFPIPLLPQIPFLSLLSFAKGGNIGDAIANEKKYGKKPMLAVVHKGEQVLSTLDGEAQQYRRLQQILGDSPLSKIKMSFATGGDLLDSLPKPYQPNIDLRSALPQPKTTYNNRQSTININTNVTMPPGSTSALTAQQVAARNAEAARRAVQRD
ncbi:MAG: tape measure protein [Xenococcaceae cyanobacterium]